MASAAGRRGAATGERCAAAALGTNSRKRNQATRLLKYLVPWGDTMFNRAQADDLRDDVHQVIRSHTGTPLADMLCKIEPLIDRLSVETHVYLWFVGD